MIPEQAAIADGVMRNSLCTAPPGAAIPDMARLGRRVRTAPAIDLAVTNKALGAFGSKGLVWEL